MKTNVTKSAPAMNTPAATQSPAISGLTGPVSESESGSGSKSSKAHSLEAPLQPLTKRADQSSPPSETAWDRSGFLGGSDIAAVLGVSTYRSAVDVWLEKTQCTPSQADSLIFRFGHFAEEFIAREYTRATAWPTHAAQTSLVHAQYPYLKAHIDRWVITDTSSDKAALPSTRRILECKTSHPQQAHLWGEPGTDQIPAPYYIQCAWYMMLAQSPMCDVAVLIGNNDFRIYTIKQDIELENFLLERALHFWQEHVLKKQAPPPRSENDCRKIYPKAQASKSMEALPSLVEAVKEYHALQKLIKVQEEQCSQIKQTVMQTLGDAETLTHQGKIIATWKSPKPSIKTDYQQLALEHPEWVIPYQSQQEGSRRLLIKEPS